MWVGLALAIALVSRWVCVAMACAKCEGQVEEQSSKKCEESAVLILSRPWPLSFSKSKLSA